MADVGLLDCVRAGSLTEAIARGPASWAKIQGPLLIPIIAAVVTAGALARRRSPRGVLICAAACLALGAFGPLVEVADSLAVIQNLKQVNERDVAFCGTTFIEGNLCGLIAAAVALAMLSIAKRAEERPLQGRPRAKAT
ncbi:MAG TPA: hypothetical protein VHF22_04405 [Planctomycetota bacterium]|nr:hypothetical protein [Planctomycetota bacterium]